MISLLVGTAVKAGVEHMKTNPTVLKAKTMVVPAALSFGGTHVSGMVATKAVGKWVPPKAASFVGPVLAGAGACYAATKIKALHRHKVAIMVGAGAAVLFGLWKAR